MKKLLIGIVTFFVLLVECVAIFGLFNDDNEVIEIIPHELNE